MTNDTTTPDTKLSGEITHDQFGTSVAINSTGDTIVVGASYADSYTGYVKVYNSTKEQ